MQDNYELWEAHERQLEQKLAERPVCSYCDKPIQDDSYYYINGENICEYCMDTRFKVDNATED